MHPHVHHHLVRNTIIAVVAISLILLGVGGFYLSRQVRSVSNAVQKANEPIEVSSDTSEPPVAGPRDQLKELTSPDGTSDISATWEGDFFGADGKPFTNRLLLRDKKTGVVTPLLERQVHPDSQTTWAELWTVFGWSPDGSKVYFGSRPVDKNTPGPGTIGYGKGVQLHELDVATKTDKIITVINANGVSSGLVDVITARNRVAYSIPADSGAKQELWISDLKGANKVKAYTMEQVDAQAWGIADVMFNPSAEKLAFITYSTSGADPSMWNFKLYFYDLASKKATEIKNANAFPDNPYSDEYSIEWPDSSHVLVRPEFEGGQGTSMEAP